MASNDVGEYRYYSCELCGGYWIPGASLTRALSARGIGELRAVPPAVGIGVDCPDCHTACGTIVLEGCALDVCGGCRGVWLDRGDVRQVSRLFPEGSAVVAAGEGRQDDRALGAICVIDGVVNLLVLVFGP